MKVILRWRKRRAVFRYPLEPVPPTAVLEPWFPSQSGSRFRLFDARDLAALERFRPGAIAASWRRLEKLSQSVRFLAAASPTHAVVVLHRFPSQEFALLSDAQREQLWRVFAVPVFEQVIGARGALLASECPAHDGLHIRSTAFGLPGEIDRSPCACGDRTPRVRAARNAQPDAVAAYAGTL